jgi:hypothetical protein
VGRGGCARQLLGSQNSLRRRSISEGGGEGGVVGVDGGRGAPAGSGGSEAGLCEVGGVRMYQSAEEEMGARVRLTGGRGGGGVSGQIPWQGGSSQRSSCSNGVEGEEREENGNDGQRFF